MTGGAGHIFDMIAKEKYNKSLRKKGSYSRKKALYQNTLRKTGRADYKQLSHEELLQVKETVRKQLQKDRRRMLIVTTGAIAIATAAIILILFYLNQLFQ